MASSGGGGGGGGGEGGTCPSGHPLGPALKNGMLSKLKILKSILLPRKMLFFEPEVLQNGRNFEERINI